MLLLVGSWIGLYESKKVRVSNVSQKRDITHLPHSRWMVDWPVMLVVSARILGEQPLIALTQQHARFLS